MKTMKIADAKILFDASTPLKQRIDLLTKNGAIGFYWFFTLFNYVSASKSFILGCFKYSYFLFGYVFSTSAPNFTINMMIFAMILVIGILVDDGIIIGENIIRKFESGLNRYDAAVEGTMEVFPAVFAGVYYSRRSFYLFLF